MEVKEKIKLDELKIDKEAIPAIAAFVVLIFIGVFMFFYWRSERSDKVRQEADNEITIATTILPLYDITRAVVGDMEDIKIVQLMPNGSDPATFEPSIDTKNELLAADVVLKIGAGFDDWIDDNVSEGIRIVDLSTYVSLLTKDGTPNLSAQDYKKICEDNGGIWLAEYNECENITQEVCEGSSGTYSSCASSCRHDEGGGGCIQVCVQVCSFGEVISISPEDIDYEQLCSDTGGEWLADYLECEGMSEEVCESNGGEYFSCESACRHEEDTDSCIEVCVEVCKFSQKNINDEYDPYYWMSVENAKKIAEAVYGELVSLRAEEADNFNSNYTEYLQSLDETKSYIEEKLDSLEDKRLIILSQAFNYFAHEYNLSIVGLFDPSELEDPSDEFKQELEKTLEEYDITTVYAESGVSEEDIQNLLPNIDLVIRTLDPYGGEEPILTYVDMMKFNADSVSGSGN